MKFKYYDTLNILISGGTFLYVLAEVLEWKILNQNIIVILPISYLIGYFMNTIGAFLEPIYYWLIGGVPSDCLLTPPKTCHFCKKTLNYTGFWRIRFYEYDKAIQLLKDELNDAHASTKKMFGKAMTYSNSNNESRVPDFNAQYAFSRVIFTLVWLSSIILSPLYYNVLWGWLLVLALVIISGIRYKERGYYYAKEVLIEYIKSKEGR